MFTDRNTFELKWLFHENVNSTRLSHKKSPTFNHFDLHKWQFHMLQSNKLENLDFTQEEKIHSQNLGRRVFFFSPSSPDALEYQKHICIYAFVLEEPNVSNFIFGCLWGEKAFRSFFVRIYCHYWIYSICSCTSLSLCPSICKEEYNQVGKLQTSR